MSHEAVSPGPSAPSSAAGPAAPADLIASGGAHVGLELGSTRIKAALIDEHGTVLATGAHPWENSYIDGNWTYALDEVWQGVQACFTDLAADVRTTHGVELTSLAGLGVSAMMHGYLALDADGTQLAPFRTWRNTYTTRASELLSSWFDLNIPLRWSISHLLHAILEGEQHVGDIDMMTTLAGYVHWRLSGQHVLGVGDASGMFPIAADGRDYDQRLLDIFTAKDEARALGRDLREILPAVRQAGQDAGSLTADGAALLDPTGKLQPGAAMAAPEGDAGTGMVATGSVSPRTGNVSAGTSAFAMVVLEGELSGPREEIDMVTTPAGDPVAMIHTNNCTGDLDAWLGLFGEFAALSGSEMDEGELYRLLFTAGGEGDPDAGGLLNYNYLSGEHQTGVDSGRPLFVRSQQARFTLANFMRSQLYGAFGALAAGMEVLLKEEGVRLETMFAHGGIFRTRGIAQQVLADSLDTPVAVGESAGEGGAWGMALLAAYTSHVAAGGGAAADDDAADRGAAAGGGAAAVGGAAAGGNPADGPLSLAEFLRSRIFADLDLTTLAPDPAGAEGYATWLRHYRTGLQVERLAGEVLD